MPVPGVARDYSGQWTTRDCPVCNKRRIMPAGAEQCGQCDEGLVNLGPKYMTMSDLKARRRAVPGLTQDRLAHLCGVTRGTISRAERGKKTFTRTCNDIYEVIEKLERVAARGGWWYTA